jgi:hypothetical protein
MCQAYAEGVREEIARKALARTHFLRSPDAVTWRESSRGKTARRSIESVKPLCRCVR